MPPPSTQRNPNGINSGADDGTAFAQALAAAMVRVGLMDAETGATRRPSSTAQPAQLLARELDWLQGALGQTGLSDAQRRALMTLLTGLQERQALSATQLRALERLQSTFGSSSSGGAGRLAPNEVAQQLQAIGLNVDEEQEDIEQLESVQHMLDKCMR
jgi:hypothetical protein